jgi:hypothetical protein
VFSAPGHPAYSSMVEEAIQPSASDVPLATGSPARVRREIRGCAPEKRESADPIIGPLGPKSGYGWM